MRYAIGAIVLGVLLLAAWMWSTGRMGDFAMLAIALLLVVFCSGAPVVIGLKQRKNRGDATRIQVRR